MTAEVINK